MGLDITAYEFIDALSLAALGVLARAVWKAQDEYRDRPFFELIHFADNEGVIGPEASADLANDFSSQREAILSRWADESDAWYRNKYDDWQRAFGIAANTGLVEFA